MLVIQLSSPSLTLFPDLTSPTNISSDHYPRRIPHGPSLSVDLFDDEKMSSKGISNQSKKTTTSVFNALGSYAERIRDSKGKLVASPSSPLESVSETQNMAVPSSSSRSRASKGDNVKTSKETPITSSAVVEEDDGQWETVQSSRPRHKTEEKEKKSAANTSRNWRERPAKDSNGSGSSHHPKDDEDSTKRPSTKGSKKGAGSASGNPVPSGTSSEKEKESTKASAPIEKQSTAAPAKPAWGVVAPVTAASLGSVSNPKPSKPEPQTRTVANASSRQPARTASSSSAQGAGVGDASVPSPDPSASTKTVSTATIASNTTATTKVDQDEEGSWRSKPKASGTETEKNKKASISPMPTAPAPAINAWDLRKKTLGSSTAIPNGNGTTSAGHAAEKPIVNNASQLIASLDDPSIESTGQMSRKKKKNLADNAEPLPAVSDPSLWPDVAQAAEVINKEDEKKDKTKDKKDAEEESVANEDSGVSGSKQTEAALLIPLISEKHKWKSIPAAELQAAADEQAENARRQAAAKKRLAKGDPSSQNSAGRSKSRKGELRAGAAGHIEGQRSASGVASENFPAANRTEGSAAGTNADASGAASTPMSRQSSTQSRLSPSKRSTQLPSPGTVANHLNHVPESSTQSASGIAGMPTATTSFTHANGSGMHSGARPPRGRDARGSFSSRGRGGFRGANGMKPFTSPVMGANGLPADGSVYARGYGMGHGFYPTANGTPMGGRAQWPQQQAGFDPVQAQYNMQLYNRGAPPPPMPQSVIPNIDAHRFYVLGQVEYYFSMQNLAMDFFLRQQMDSEGWIDISMIASFNRLRSLTPDVAMVKEVMELSSILEVREDKVRLAGQESKRWVLPNAPISSFPPDPLSPTRDSVFDEQQSQLSVDHEITNMALELAGLDAPYTHAPGGVENALMKSVAPSSSASLSNGEVEAGNESLDKADVDDTPATSTSGDEVKELR